MDSAKYRIENQAKTLPANYYGLLSDYRRFYVVHAGDIVFQLPRNKTSSHELSLIAGAFSDVDDVESAKLFFKKSILRANSTTEKILSKRNYARFIFNKIDRNKGDEKFEEVLKEYDEDNDIIRHYRGETYIRWASLYPKPSIKNVELLNRAISEFSKYKSEGLMERDLKLVEDLLKPSIL